ncbi:hypothetical protein L3X38_008916 [Prunus dulcis]|uniref:Gnk2-homologous domain-containing protein n=1 Tax=Prunus dulcis TaxID=3755 RepID=A0AAD4ZXK0_PRUDU|nr:hypothetical protein L3X38_008916 [Prunus dulcis]
MLEFDHHPSCGRCIQAAGHGGMLHLGKSKKDSIHSVSQCTGDLSSIDCKKCLDVAMSELLYQMHEMSGARAYYGSCYIRFELYPFI